MTKAMVWIAAVAALLFTFDVASAQSTEDDPAQVEAGAEVFAANCSSCHGAEGEGSAAGRPLTGVADQADRAQHIMSVTDGRNSMPAFGSVLSADEIDSVVSFVRLTFVAQDDGGDDGEASEEEAPAEELADTGVESAVGVIAAVALLAGGAMVLRTSRLQARRD